MRSATMLCVNSGADWLYFLAREQFDQTGPQIVENVNQWAEILRNANVSMIPQTLSLRASSRIAQPASPPLFELTSADNTMTLVLTTREIEVNYFTSQT